MNAWMNSSGHRANILNEKMEYIGVGVFYQDEVYYWSQFFAISNSLFNGAYLPGEKEDTVTPSFTTTPQPLTTTQVTTTAKPVTIVITTTDTTTTTMTQVTTTTKTISTTSIQPIAAEETTTTTKCSETSLVYDCNQACDFSTIIKRILCYTR